MEQKCFLMEQGHKAMESFLRQQNEIADQSELYAPFGGDDASSYSY
jgi:hypothetical protein